VVALITAVKPSGTWQQRKYRKFYLDSSLKTSNLHGKNNDPAYILKNTKDSKD
jgi:hypothetical protein